MRPGDPAGRHPGVVTAVLAVVLAAAVVAGTFLVVDLQRHVTVQADRDEAIRIARQFAVNFTTFDHRTLQRDRERVLELSAGTFHREFVETEEAMEGLVAANRTVTEGEVLEVGISSFGSGFAEVLVAVDARVERATNDEAEWGHYRLELDLVRDGGEWKVVDMRFVG